MGEGRRPRVNSDRAQMLRRLSGWRLVLLYHGRHESYLQFDTYVYQLSHQGSTGKVKFQAIR